MDAGANTSKSTSTKGAPGVRTSRRPRAAEPDLRDRAAAAALSELGGDHDAHDGGHDQVDDGNDVGPVVQPRNLATVIADVRSVVRCGLYVGQLARVRRTPTKAPRLDRSDAFADRAAETFAARVPERFDTALKIAGFVADGLSSWCEDLISDAIEAARPGKITVESAR